MIRRATFSARQPKDAQRAVAQAAGLADASTVEGIRDLAQNEAALAAAHQHALDLFDQMTTSADERAEAELRLGKANFRVADAQEAINKLNEKGTDVDEDVAAAHERVTEAQERRIEVQERLAEAQRSVMTDGENVIRMLQEQATKATEWGRNMDAAARMGIDQGILRQLARLGPEGNPLLLGFMDAATRFGAGALGAIQRSTEGIVTKVMADVGVLHAFLAREAEKYAEDGAKAGDQYGASFSAKAKEWINNLTVDIPKILAGGAPALAKLNPFLGLLAGIGSKVAEDPAGFLGRAKDFLGFHAGGLVRMHAGGLRPDEVPTVLQTGEFVQRRAAVEKYGAGTMEAINAGTWAGGGGMGPVTINAPVYVDGSADERTVSKMQRLMADNNHRLLVALQSRQPRRSA